MSEIKNGIVSLEDLFAANVFRIPQYQRAYAWQRQPQLQAFVDDLVQQAHTQARSTHKRYFLGTLLLHADASGVDSPVDVVDGQQRLTTTVIFMATAVRLAEQGRIELDDAASLKNAFLRDATTERQKFHTIREDSLYFRHRILDHSPNAPAAESPSARLMRDASDFFDAAIPARQWPALVATLRAANVMVYAVDNAEDATQIFELQNDRGRPLTTLESLKSFLMHSIYIHSPKRADEHLADVQDQFSKIFRAVENLQSIDGAPDEDQVLSNHCTAFEEWTEKEYANPKQLRLAEP